MNSKILALSLILFSPFFSGWGFAQEGLPGTPPPGILLPPPPPQPLIPELEKTPSPKEIKLLEVEIEVKTPPGSKVSIPLASRAESDTLATDFRFRIPTIYKKVKMSVEGPFGGKMIREISLEKVSSPLEISEGLIVGESTDPDPTTVDRLPQICPRLVSKSELAFKEIVPVNRKQVLPETAVYDGRRDLLSQTAKEKNNLAFLQSARLSFDSEDTSVLVGIHPKTSNPIFEKGGGFYSNYHYVVFSYREGLEKLYREMEGDLMTLRRSEKELRENRLSSSQKARLEEKLKGAYEALQGKDSETGPYQILMHAAFNTLERINRQDLQKTFGSPLTHGFIPGPFQGSRHWGYSLCEWGDTARHAPLQKMQYENVPLWRWQSSSQDEKVILLVIEGDDQLNESPYRRELIEKGVIRATDYTDDLIAFFVISRGDTLKENSTSSSLLQDFSLQMKTQ